MTDDQTQKDVISFLESGAGSGQPADERIDTQISHVFLIGHRVFKLKRAIKLPFLDYSTIEARRSACDTEIVVNRRTAPGIYLGVRSVTDDGDGLSFDGDGQPLDYVVEMRRFDQNTLFDRLIGRGELDETLIRQLADVIADFHKSAEIRRDLGGHDSLRKAFADVAKTLQDKHPAFLSDHKIKRICRRIGRAIDEHQRLLDARRRHGFVRHCHGDLHLGNICLHKGRPTLFDAIEFSESIAVIDPLYDIAFTLMDLWARGRRDLSNVLLSRYLEATRDYAGLSLLPVLIAIRAVIRTMSEALSGENPDIQMARRYLKCADDAAHWQPQPALIAIGGLSGTGKSTLARKLSFSGFDGTGAIRLRSDSIRKRLFGQAPEVPLGEEAYAPGFSARVYGRILKDARRTLAAGYPVIADATYMSEQQRRSIETRAEKLAVPFLGIWLFAPAEILCERVAGRTGDASDADVEVLRAQLRAKTGRIEWVHLDCSGQLEDTHEKALKLVSASMGKVQK